MIVPPYLNLPLLTSFRRFLQEGRNCLRSQTCVHCKTHLTMAEHSRPDISKMEPTDLESLLEIWKADTFKRLARRTCSLYPACSKYSECAACFDENKGWPVYQFCMAYTKSQADLERLGWEIDRDTERFKALVFRRFFMSVLKWHPWRR